MSHHEGCDCGICVPRTSDGMRKEYDFSTAKVGPVVPLERKKISAEYPIPMDTEFISPEQFIKDIKKTVQEAKDAGFTLIQVILGAGGEYDDRYDYPAIYGERMETDEELALRTLAKKRHSDKMKAIWIKRKAAKANK